MNTVDGQTGGRVNTQWAIDLFDQLADEGLRHVVLSPGSRGTPLALAADAHPDIATTVHIDERGAAYYALGIARATARPTAVVTTSGTAAANLLPACAEAHNDNVPLLLLTADRPPRLRDTGANQTMDQVGVYSDFLRFEADLPVPAEHDASHLLATAQEAMRRAQAWPPGPVHLNVPFEKPLEPDAAGQAALQRLRLQAPRPAATHPPAAPTATQAVSSLPTATDAPTVPAGLPDIDVGRLGRRGVIVCGPGTGVALAADLVRLGRHLGAPVLADALSGIRFGHDSLGAYDLFIDSPVATALRPDFVLQFGRSPTSQALRRYLAMQTCRRYRLDHSGRRWDDIGGQVTFVDADARRWIDKLLDVCAAVGGEGADPIGDAGWLPAWKALDQTARDAADAALAACPEVEAAWVPAVLRRASRLFVGNSLPVRDLDRFGTSVHPVVTAANRGVSGIDGTIATAAGWAVGGAATAVVGDVAFQHDVGSLPLVAQRLRLVVIRNGGGRIFQHLPIHKATDRFERLFLTPPQVDIEKACAAFGLDAATTVPSRLAEALREKAPVVVVDVDGQASVDWRQQVARRVHEDVAHLSLQA